MLRETLLDVGKWNDPDISVCNRPLDTNGIEAVLENAEGTPPKHTCSRPELRIDRLVLPVISPLSLQGKICPDCVIKDALLMSF